MKYYRTLSNTMKTNYHENMSHMQNIIYVCVHIIILYTSIYYLFVMLHIMDKMYVYKLMCINIIFHLDYYV